MKRFFTLILATVIGSAPLLADPLDALFEELSFRRDKAEQRKPELDPKRIVNQSNAFLKEREPEMTGEEYALYEKVSGMLSTNVDLALKLLESMMTEAEKPSPAFEFLLGNIYYAGNQYDRSEQHYRNAVARYPNFLRAWNNLGILYYSQNRFDPAVDCFSKSVALGDRDPTTFGMLGYCLEKENNVVPSEMAYMQALSGDPKNPDWKEGLLRVYVNGKQYARAESLVTKLIKDQPSEPRFWMAYAGILIAENRKLEAVALLDTAARAGVADADQRLLMGDLFADLGLPKRAVDAYQSALPAAREQGEEKILHYARALLSAEKPAQAEEVLNSLKSNLTPKNRLAYLQVHADLAIAQQRWNEARADAEALLNLSPLDGPALLTLGRCYAAQHDVARAALAFESAFRIPETTYRASLELAAIEMKNRHYEKSIEYLEKALSLQKTDTVEDALSRVRALRAHEPNPAS